MIHPVVLINPDTNYIFLTYLYLSHVIILFCSHSLSYACEHTTHLHCVLQSHVMHIHSWFKPYMANVHEKSWNREWIYWKWKKNM